MSWDYETNNDHPVFTGYYNTSSPWDTIEQVFLDRFNIQAMAVVFRDRSSYQIKVEYQKDTLIIWRKGAKKVFTLESIQVESVKVPVFRIDYKCLADKPFYNWDISIADLKFSLNQMRDAVLVGLQEGLAAGLSGSKQIEGMNPEDFAWKFALAFVGTRYSSVLE